MRRKESLKLAELELELMKVIWDKGKATVQEVRDALKSNRPLAYTTILTMLSILERKKFLKHKKAGRAYVYYPAVSEKETRSSLVRDLINRVFRGSPELLLVSILEEEKIKPDELKRLREMVKKKRKG